MIFLFISTILLSGSDAVLCVDFVPDWLVESHFSLTAGNCSTVLACLVHPQHGASQ